MSTSFIDYVVKLSTEYLQLSDQSLLSMRVKILCTKSQLYLVKRMKFEVHVTKDPDLPRVKFNK